MRRLHTIAPLALAALLLVPVTAAALDCTPFLNWTCGSPAYFNVLNGQPGEVVCGVDYTGWTLHVVNVTVAQAGWIRFAGASASASMAYVDTAIMLMGDCAMGTCLASEQSSGLTELDVCLDVGTHSFLVASHTTAPGAFMNIGLACQTCLQAEQFGFPCPYCNAVADEGTTWGSLKGTYR